MVESPSNPRLVRALAAMLDAPEAMMDGLMRPFLNELVEAWLVTGREPLIVRRGADRYLALFTDVVELQLYEREEPWTVLRADEAIKQVARGDYGGLIVNPGPRQFQLSRADVADFFDIDG